MASASVIGIWKRATAKPASKRASARPGTSARRRAGHLYRFIVCVYVLSGLGVAFRGAEGCVRV